MDGDDNNKVELADLRYQLQSLQKDLNGHLEEIKLWQKEVMLQLEDYRESKAIAKGVWGTICMVIAGAGAILTAFLSEIKRWLAG